MNTAQLTTTPSGSSALGLLLVIGVACWCWFGRGPLMLRWPMVVLVVLLTSGHWAGNVVGAYLDVLAQPLLTLLLMLLGLWIIIRGVVGHQREPYQREHYRHGRDWHDRRW